MVAPTAKTLPFGPTPRAVDSTPLPLPLPPAPVPSLPPSLIADLASPHHSLVSIAEKHNIDLEALTLLLALPQTRDRLDVAESAGYTHLRLAASLNLAAAAHALVRIIEDFRTLATSPDRPSLTDPDYIRASERARKASWLLYQLSRLNPNAAPCPKTRARNEADPATDAPTPLPPQPTPQPAPQPTPPETTASRPLSSPDHHEAHPEPADTTHHAAPTNEPTDLPAIEQLVEQLESLSAALGLDPSDIDDSEPLTPEMLAELPPELAEFLATLDPAPPPAPPPNPPPNPPHAPPPVPPPDPPTPPTVGDEHRPSPTPTESPPGLVSAAP